MNEVTTITTKGQVTIPGTIRQILNAKVGDKVLFAKVFPNSGEVMIKIIPTNIVDELSGSLFAKRKESDYQRARIGAGKLLVKKYRVK